jgi:hypothetical protein
MVLGKLGMKENEVAYLSYTIYKNSLKMNQRPKFILELKLGGKDL